jgi:hypothetical protein
MIFDMTREEAEHRAAELNEQSSGDRWFARGNANRWEVVKVALPPRVRLDPLKQASPQATRPTPAGPPPAYHRHFDGAGGAGGV